MSFLSFVINSQKKKLNDTIFLGLLGGFAGTFFMDLSNYLIFKAGKSEVLYGHIAGELWVTPHRTKRRKNFLIGEITHFGIGSLWGILTSYLFKITGKDHHLLKGLAISALSLGTLVGGQKIGWLKKFRFTKTIYSAFWNHMVYGLISSQFIFWFSDSPEHNPPSSKIKSCRNKLAETAETEDTQ